jgi:hypothetical protein
MSYDRSTEYLTLTQTSDKKERCSIRNGATTTYQNIRFL